MVHDILMWTQKRIILGFPMAWVVAVGALYKIALVPYMWQEKLMPPSLFQGRLGKDAHWPLSYSY